MKKEAARTHINGETQDVARKMNKVLRQERPRWRVESVTPRRLDVTCHFRLDQRENLAVDKRQDLSSKPAARRIETRPHGDCNLSTKMHTKHDEERSRPHTHQWRDARCRAEDEPIVTPRKTTWAYGVGDASRA